MADTGKISRDWKYELTGATFAFAGMNFMVDPADLPLDSGQCVDICNCDIDYKNNASRRKGFYRVASGNFANVWSNGTYMYCTKDNALCICTMTVNSSGIPTITTAPIVGAPVMNDVVEFKQVNNVVAFSDGTTFGILDGHDVTIIGEPIFGV